MKLTQLWCISIVAVQGIGANPDKTWKIKNVNWLKDVKMFQSKVPKARMLKYEYESIWFRDNPIRQTLSEVAITLLEELNEAKKVSQAGTWSLESMD